MISWDDKKRVDKIYRMWQRNFHDPSAYADFYFQEVYRNNEVVLSIAVGDSPVFMPVINGNDSLPEAEGAEPEEETAVKEETEEGEDILKGMIHINPYTMIMSGKALPVHYIVGVATDEDYRRQGVMRSLLAETFARLRDRGECLTYLMPADEAYYLPFDFRFGRPRIEQEYIVTGEEAFVAESPGAGSGAGGRTKDLTERVRYTFRNNLTADELSACAGAETSWKKAHYDLFTEITPEYLKRLEKETKADYGMMFYVFQGDLFRGRFCATPEADTLILSRVFSGDGRKEFLKEVMTYTRREFHYGNHQLILDNSWEELVKELSTDREGLPGLRMMPARFPSKIMFRILDLEGLSPYLRADREADFTVFVEDDFLPENAGTYHFRCLGGEVEIRRNTGIKDSGREYFLEDSPEGGVPAARAPEAKAPETGDSEAGQDEASLPVVSIADLTSWIFGGDRFRGILCGKEGDRTGEQKGEKAGSKEGSGEIVPEAVPDLLKAICPIEISCIMEIV